jgi:NADH-quinone oxidoreductase subunit F
MARKILTEHINVPGIETFDVYRKQGGYTAVEKAIKTMTPEEVVEEAKKSGVRGRGGAGFPMGMKWGFLAKPEGVPRYLVCNADESEPGTFKDHHLMKSIPHLLIEGMIISSFALGANKSFIYVRGELMYVIRILEKAIEEAKAKGFLGKNILGSGYDLELVVQPGGGAYICGEETALLESLEGKRGNPRNKPPFPAVKGLYQSPTVVNNVESIANMSWIINNGGDTYATIGIGRSTGTKLISASGHIQKPGVYEIELGVSVEEFLNSDEYCGGIRKGHHLKALVAGGSSVPILPANLIMKTANGEDRLMSTNHCQTEDLLPVPCWARAGLLFLMKQPALSETHGIFHVFITTNPVDNAVPAVKERVGWKKFCTGSNMAMAACMILIFW